MVCYQGTLSLPNQGPHVGWKIALFAVIHAGEGKLMYLEGMQHGRRGNVVICHSFKESFAYCCISLYQFYQGLSRALKKTYGSGELQTLGNYTGSPNKIVVLGINPALLADSKIASSSMSASFSKARPAPLP